MGKRTPQKDTIKDRTSDSQVNSYFSYRWSPAYLKFNIYFYLFLYLYITRITINNDIQHLKSTKNQIRRAALGRPAIKLLGVGGLQLVCGRPTLALCSALVLQTFCCSDFKQTDIQRNSFKNISKGGKQGNGYHNKLWLSVCDIFLFFSLSLEDGPIRNDRSV